MYIKNIEAVTRLHICPKCKIYCLAATDHGNYHKYRFEKHVEKCTGKFKPELILPTTRKPYVPHIQKNKIFAYLFAHDRINEYEPIRNYITFDFKTIEHRENKRISEKMISLGTLIPISIAWTIKGKSTKTKFLMNEDSQNIDIFINNWLNQMFQDVQEIYEIRKKFNEKMKEIENEEENEENEEEQNNDKNKKKIKNLRILKF
jgi:hypothetical protein